MFAEVIMKHQIALGALEDTLNQSVLYTQIYMKILRTIFVVLRRNIRILFIEILIRVLKQNIRKN